MNSSKSLPSLVITSFVFKISFLISFISENSATSSTVFVNSLDKPLTLAMTDLMVFITTGSSLGPTKMTHTIRMMDISIQPKENINLPF